MNPAMLLNWLDVAPDFLAAFDLWHNREHVMERLGIPGFVQGRRYVALSLPAREGHCYLIIYDVRELAVLASADYAARLDAPSDMTRAVVPALRAMTRTACEITASLGCGIGGFVRTIKLWSLSAALSADAECLRDALAAIYRCDSVTAVHLGRPDATVTHFKDATQEGQVSDTRRRTNYPWCLVIEACRPEALDAAEATLRRAVNTRAPEHEIQLESDSYRLVFTMTADQALPGAGGYSQDLPETPSSPQ